MRETDLNFGAELDRYLTTEPDENFLNDDDYDNYLEAKYAEAVERYYYE